MDVCQVDPTLLYPTLSLGTDMIPGFNDSGLLPPGIHWASWDELMARFGTNWWRLQLAAGFRAAIEDLKQAGCRAVYLDGSFVTDKRYPNDFDACWEEAGVDPAALDPTLLEFGSGRAAQKAKYLGELFPSSAIAGAGSFSFLEFFQVDKESGEPKGVIGINLRDLK